MSSIDFLTKLKLNRGGRLCNEAYRYYRLSQVEGQPLWWYYFPNLKYHITKNTVSNAVMGAALKEEERLYEKREQERKEPETPQSILGPSGMPIKSM